MIAISTENGDFLELFFVVRGEIAKNLTKVFVFLPFLTITKALMRRPWPRRRVTNGHKYLTAASTLDTDHLDLCNDTQSHTISCETLPYNQ